MTECNASRSDSAQSTPSMHIENELLSHIFRVSSHGLRLFVHVPESETQSQILSELCKGILDEFTNLIVEFNYKAQGSWLSVEIFFDDIRDAMEANTLLLKRWRHASLKIKVEYISPAQKSNKSLRCLSSFAIPKTAQVNKYIELWRTQLQGSFDSVLGISAIPELAKDSERYLDIWFYSISSKIEFVMNLKHRKEGLLHYVSDSYSEYRSRRELIVNRATFLPRHLEIYTSIKKFLILALMVPHFNFDLSHPQETCENDSVKLYKEKDQNLPELSSTIKKSQKQDANYEVILNPEIGSSLPRSSPLFHPPLSKDILNQLHSIPTTLQFAKKPFVSEFSPMQAICDSQENKCPPMVKERLQENQSQASTTYSRANPKERYRVKNSEQQKGLFNPSYCPPKANHNFSIDIDAALSGRDKRRTVMLKNIPNSLSQKDVMKLIDVKFQGCYDYFYLPIDFKYHRNVGYAFVNLNSAETVARFVKEFQGMRWKSSHKIADVTYGRTQGLKALIQAAKHSQVGKTQNDPRLKPVILKLR